MPTYEYECESCGHEMEIFQKMSDAPLKVCPECGKEGLRRKIGTGAGIIFKGSGFYETDYRSSDYKEAAKKEREGGKSSDSSKTDSNSDKKGSGDTGKKSAESGGSSDKK